MEFMFTLPTEMETDIGKLLLVEPKTVFDNLYEQFETDLSNYIEYLRKKMNFRTLLVHKHRLQALSFRPSEEQEFTPLTNFNLSSINSIRNTTIDSYADKQETNLSDIKINLENCRYMLSTYDIESLFTDRHGDYDFKNLADFKKLLYDIDFFAFVDGESSNNLEKLSTRAFNAAQEMSRSLDRYYDKNSLQNKFVRFMTKQRKFSNIVDFLPVNSYG